MPISHINSLNINCAYPSNNKAGPAVQLGRPLFNLYLSSGNPLSSGDHHPFHSLFPDHLDHLTLVLVNIQHAHHVHARWQNFPWLDHQHIVSLNKSPEALHI